jgi:hypothetical protein
LHFGWAFTMQYGIGLVVGQWPSQDGHYPVAAYQAAFGLCLALQAASWCGLRCHGSERSAEMPSVNPPEAPLDPAALPLTVLFLRRAQEPTGRLRVVCVEAVRLPSTLAAKHPKADLLCSP